VGEKSEVGAQCAFMASFKAGRGEIAGETTGRCGCERSRIERGGWRKGKGLMGRPCQLVTRGRREGVGPLRDRWAGRGCWAGGEESRPTGRPGPLRPKGRIERCLGLRDFLLLKNLFKPLKI
jgi:hypothetical protein